MNATVQASDPTNELPAFEPAAFAARKHSFRAVAFVSGLYLAVVLSAPWILLDSSAGTAGQMMSVAELVVANQAAKAH